MTDVGPTPTLEMAHAEAMSLAGELDAVALRAAGRAARVGLIVAEVAPTLAASPATGAAAEAALGVVGGLGVTSGLHAEAAAHGVRTTVRLISGADVAAARLHPLVEAEFGVAGTALALTPAGAAARLLLTAYSVRQPGSAAVLAPPTLATTAPHSLVDLLRTLDQVNEAGPVIAVQTLTAPDGRRRHIVYLRGTDTLSPLDTASQRNLRTDASVRLGRPTSYQASIERAMRASGIAATEPVLIVGHSLGGMEAAEIAQSRRYHVTNIVTAGSPVQDQSLPAYTRLISLENHGDVVPTLDGDPGRDRPGKVTVRFDDGHAAPWAAHGLDHYVHGAQAAEASPQPAVKSALADLAPFYGEAELESRTWTLSRAGE
ncbi:hypothetical protein [Nocardioides sp. Kera G14]|uniref:PGAP1-like alpha/beta domain-containing protein n=1 Tax=Nocardioides sp. Kera G14 TaxID=2884264 RepID=UPI001D1140B4|nr:hypothetical protein [Nocardioides sp. Kera G14]UDY23695.1 hypothetical protein LH076_16790 [Nocardioides sp. Kera G14]